MGYIQTFKTFSEEICTPNDVISAGLTETYKTNPPWLLKHGATSGGIISFK